MSQVPHRRRPTPRRLQAHQQHTQPGPQRAQQATLCPPSLQQPAGSRQPGWSGGTHNSSGVRFGLPPGTAGALQGAWGPGGGGGGGGFAVGGGHPLAPGGGGGSAALAAVVGSAPAQPAGLVKQPASKSVALSFNIQARAGGPAGTVPAAARLPREPAAGRQGGAATAAAAAGAEQRRLSSHAPVPAHYADLPPKRQPNQGDRR